MQRSRRDHTGFSGVHLSPFSLVYLIFPSVSNPANANIFLHCQGVWRDVGLCCGVFVVLRDYLGCLGVNKIVVWPQLGRQPGGLEKLQSSWGGQPEPQLHSRLNHRRQGNSDECFWTVFNNIITHGRPRPSTSGRLQAVHDSHLSLLAKRRLYVYFYSGFVGLAISTFLLWASPTLEEYWLWKQRGSEGSAKPLWTHTTKLGNFCVSFLADDHICHLLARICLF